MSVINVLKAIVEGKVTCIDITPKDATVEAFVFKPKASDVDMHYNPMALGTPTPMTSLVMPFIQASCTPSGQTIIETKDGIYLGALSYSGPSQMGMMPNGLSPNPYQRLSFNHQLTFLNFPIRVTGRELTRTERAAYIVDKYSYVDFSDMTENDLLNDEKVAKRINSGWVGAQALHTEAQTPPQINVSLTLDLSAAILPLDRLVFIIQYVELYFESLQFTNKVSCGRGCLNVFLPREVRTSKQSRYGETSIASIVDQYLEQPSSVSVGVNVDDIFASIKTAFANPSIDPRNMVPMYPVGGSVMYGPGANPATTGPYNTGPSSFTGQPF